jgi:hypothetical protein
MCNQEEGLTVRDLFRASTVLVGMLVLLGSAALCYADSALVLPKGRFRFNVNTNLYYGVDERYDPDGNEEDIAANFNAPLTSFVFPGLGQIEEGFGMPPGSATIGTSDVDFTLKWTDLEFDLWYGLTDKVTLGIHVPYFFSKTEVDVNIDTSDATLGFNPDFGTPQDKFGSPIIPVALGGVKNDELATEFVQQILEEEFGYERLKDWSDSGLSDIEAGFRYQYFKNEDWRLAVTSAVRFPTGGQDDPNNLIDQDFGEGAWALLFWLNTDYTGIDRLLLNATVSYDWKLPYSQTLRVRNDVNQPLTVNTEKVDINIGNVFEIDLLARFDVTPAWSVSLNYEYNKAGETDVDGNMGFAYESLEEETAWTAHGIAPGITYSTFPAFEAKKFPIPMHVYLEYWDYFSGSNNYLNQQFFKVGAAVYF